MTKKLLLSIAVLSLLCAFPALAQENPHDKALTAQASGTAVAVRFDIASPAATTVFYNSLGPNAKDSYDDLSGEAVLGNANPTLAPGTSVAVAVNFHATANEHLTTIKMPVVYANLKDKAAKTFNVTIYNDANGAPGAAISAPVAAVTSGNFPPPAKCCPLVTVNFPAPGVALTANTKYWVVANTVAGSTTEAYWDFTYLTLAVNVGGAGWIEEPSNLPAGEISGTIP